MSGNVDLVTKADVTGSIYLPNQRLSISGSADLVLKGTFDKLVARSFSISGSGNVSVQADDSQELMASTKVRLVR